MLVANSMEKVPSERRRSPRYDVQIPAILRAKDEVGRSFFQRTKIVSIDIHGARIRTHLSLDVGEKVEVQIVNEKEPRRFNVVWVGSVGTPEAGTAGLTFAERNKSWEIEALSEWGIEVP